MKLKSCLLLVALLSSVATQNVIAASDELVAAAKAEGEVTVYSITSRIANAAKSFEEKYGIKVSAHNLKGYELITKVTKEGQGGVAGADFVIAQDAGRVFGELIEPGYVYSYMPESYKDIIPAKYQNPLAFTFITKVFTYNSETFTFPPVDNIWELTEPKWNEKFYFKDPLKEGVNANFLTMLTSEKMAKKMAASYKRYFKKDITLTTPNAGYEWIKMLIANKPVMFTSDTKMTTALGTKGNGISAVALGTYSKVRYRHKKNLALMPIMGMEPFAGFVYPSYLLISKKAKNPNAAKLFIEYLLSPEGFKPWAKSLGTYSSNPNIKPFPGDNSFAVWSQLLVYEDPEFTFQNRVDVEDFWNNLIYQ
ncbi:MAG: ABC transporter substrate-binding protein [Desulfotalea sp.]